MNKYERMGGIDALVIMSAVGTLYILAIASTIFAGSTILQALFNIGG